MRRKGKSEALGYAFWAVYIPAQVAHIAGPSGYLFAAVVVGVLFAGGAWAAWPTEPTEAEERVEDLYDCWSEARPDALGPSPYERFAAWAEAVDDEVELHLLRCAPTTEPVAEALPFPLSHERIRTLDPSAMVDAVTLMERLRTYAANREERARTALLEAASAAEQRAHEEKLRAIDAAAAAYQRREEEEMRREVAEAEALERRAQAVAVAEALRRP